MQVGKYQLIRELAVGGMAEVFLARTAGPMGFEKLLVLKRILPHMAREPAFIQMFFSEATLAARLTHPNIVQIFDFGESDGSYYLAMEYLDGPSLRTLLDDSLRLGGPLPPVPCARIIASACEGLAFAHDFRDPATGQPLDIVHRDISPDNILLSRQGAVKVVDFGIAKAAGQQHRTQTGMIKGKLAYMPPEQIRNQTLDRRVDVYALGLVFYELVTGQRPFDAPTEASLMHSILFELPMPAVLRQPDLPEPVQRILQRALAKDRDQRYPDCFAFQADLEEYILSTGRPVTTQHIAQLIAQVSPPIHDAPLPALPPGSPPLEDTTLRVAPDQSTLPPGSPPLEDTMLRSAPTLDSLPPRVDLSPSLVAESSAMGIPRTLQLEAPPPPRPRVDAIPTVETPAAPSRKTGMLRAALVGVALLAAAGGYLLVGRTPSAPSDAPAPTHAESPPSPESAAVTGDTGDTAPLAEKDPAPTTGKPVSPPPGNAAGEASAGVSSEVRAHHDAKSGVIEFEVRPSAVVYLEGKRLMKGPRGVLDINPGTYTLRFVNKKLRKKVERSVEVRAGQTAFIQVDLLHDEEAQKP
ncbi:serine/threonine protein kinase [Hyalangium sp.]|uniref:serine/threonine protein kinase n=1 Tax=Hyalangium sp. TaxID=2028555 RepID=UPI002D458BF0|nr:protein kinase [Hyalangium sp.]HYI00523.1 protein kinase [Hyalangium sp.]